MAFRNSDTLLPRYVEGYHKAMTTNTPNVFSYDLGLSSSMREGITNLIEQNLSNHQQEAEIRASGIFKIAGKFSNQVIFTIGRATSDERDEIKRSWQTRILNNEEIPYHFKLLLFRIAQFCGGRSYCLNPRSSPVDKSIAELIGMEAVLLEAFNDDIFLATDNVYQQHLLDVSKEVYNSVCRLEAALPDRIDRTCSTVLRCLSNFILYESYNTDVQFFKIHLVHMPQN
ncbi:hypothetical protein MJO29_002614 [Puccinia striiformis f. sp. tritici]|nr:hypothetical protein MJO29_002614 [Puccinia striiformis f. sp. tritici]